MKKAVIGHTTRREVTFVGPYGVGKSTAVRSLSDIPVVNTEVMSTMARPGGRAARRMTTVGLDYGEWGSNYGAVAVVGTPGQARFQSTRDHARGRASAVVLWMYGQNEYALEETAEWIKVLGNEQTWSRLTVAVTRLDEGENHPALEDYRPVLDSFSPDIRLLAGDPRDRDSVIRVVETALASTKKKKARS
ncbi:GTP-binding protein [Dermatophilus congolensis]|uniref:GTP-binding protein n=1 Tax=Dermatophilus congolensis TaxID=1863 RepID=UPI000551A47B|nr:hypothetical protein [Dermatophilus congolensis]MBO3129161.1 hypothetical protein [Dermatophilus congolensis]MBO3132203.1 hypothetical protein [Dermatophilus congolensis]MBO3133638.1 hypothetical protein [Dermatophilus congolensis]MBO3135871.1 hypothetical protein [Dermatophilus congolensis]MBO3138111.1 hypothetical protein [Dermatophilus congolensis]